MQPHSQQRVSPWRFYLVIIVIALLILGLAARLFYLTIFDQHFLRQQGDERVLRLIQTPALRGMISDRNGSPLAVSTQVYSIWINPETFSPPPQSLQKLGELINLKPKFILASARAGKKKKRTFLYLKRALSPEITTIIQALKIPGLYTQEEFRRYYPEGEAAAHVIGFTNIDDQGQEGAELAFNQWMQGQPSKKWVIKDRLGRVIADVQTIQERKSGNKLVLSLDRRIQYLAYRELLSGVIKNKAKSGSIVVLDTQTGEVLAMANVPSFNPNNRLMKISEALRNRAITDIYEPGSTMKAFSIACALDSKRFNPNSIIDTYPGWIRVGHNVVKDHQNEGKLSVTQILAKSSNVGVSKMILTLTPDKLWQMLHRVGFGETAGIGLPGEQNGVLVNRHPWPLFALATLSYGYGLSVTTLQLAKAYSVLANEGIKRPVSILALSHPSLGERVLSQNLAKQMLLLLEAAVISDEGTGKLANVPGYRVAGKTGTARLAGVGGYQQRRYLSSFVGIAPLTRPRLVVAVVINDPQGKDYYGALVAAPIFEKVMEGSLRIMDVPPDKV